MHSATFGSRAGCSACGQEIEFDGEAWRHLGPAQPRHIATPGAPLVRPHPALLDAAGALAAAVAWVQGQNAGPDDPEPFILELAGPFADGWAARVIWEHHDGPINLYAATGLPLADALRRLIAAPPPDPAQEPAEHPATARDVVARLEAERDAARADAKRAQELAAYREETVRALGAEIQRLTAERDAAARRADGVGRLWAERDARQTAAIADATRQGLRAAAQAAALLRCYLSIAPGATEAEVFAEVQDHGERILEVIDAAIDVAGFSVGPAWRLAESLPTLRAKVQALLDAEKVSSTKGGGDE